MMKKITDILKIKLAPYLYLTMITLIMVMTGLTDSLVCGIFIALSLIFFVLMINIYQMLIKTNTFDVYDILSTAAGGLIPIIIYILIWLI